MTKDSKTKQAKRIQSLVQSVLNLKKEYKGLEEYKKQILNIQKKHDT